MKHIKLPKESLPHGVKTLANKMQRLVNLYEELMHIASTSSSLSKVVRFNQEKIVKNALDVFGPQLTLPNSKILPNELFEVAVHLPTQAVIIASRASTIHAKTTVYSRTFNTNFQSFSIYMPGLGIEVANVGRVGEINNDLFVLRSESACTPAFLFGAQSCNCAFQWRCTQELAAYFNSDKETNSAPIGFLMVHLESQNGMGMGYTPDTFAIDLGSRAHLRYAASLAVSQRKQLSIQETFQALGIPSDPRQAANEAGYKITPIILDFLNTHQEMILLSNNPKKINGLKEFGYRPQRIKTLGEITAEGLLEAKQRSCDFGHLDIGSEMTTFDKEFQFLKTQINRRNYVS